MLRRILPLVAALLLAAVPGRPDDNKKNDGDVAVKEGEEFKLKRDEISVAAQPDDEGRFPVTVKAAKEPLTLKMPAQRWMLGLVPDAKHKDAGVKIDSVVEAGPLQQMRVAPKNVEERGGWMADPGDVITHVNGFAIKDVKDLICTVNAAKDPGDVQLVVKDVNNGKPYVFYVSAARR